MCRCEFTTRLVSKKIKKYCGFKIGEKKNQGFNRKISEMVEKERKATGYKGPVVINGINKSGGEIFLQNKDKAKIVYKDDFYRVRVFAYTHKFLKEIENDLRKNKK